MIYLHNPHYTVFYGLNVFNTLTRGVKVTSGMDPRNNRSGPCLIVLSVVECSVVEVRWRMCRSVTRVSLGARRGHAASGANAYGARIHCVVR